MGNGEWGMGNKNNYQLPITNYQLPITNYQCPMPILSLDRYILNFNLTTLLRKNS
jgi:hypothetical protein